LKDLVKFNPKEKSGNFLGGGNVLKKEAGEFKMKN